MCQNCFFDPFKRIEEAASAEKPAEAAGTFTKWHMYLKKNRLFIFLQSTFSCNFLHFLFFYWFLLLFYLAESFVKKAGRRLFAKTGVHPPVKYSWFIRFHLSILFQEFRLSQK